MEKMASKSLGTGNTRAGTWLRKYGWELVYTKPHGFAETHYWRSPDGEYLCTQTMALMYQRSLNRQKKGI